MAALAPNPRASLLSGLRTGGVRSTSSPLGNGIPHTAAPGGGFNIRSIPQNHGKPMIFQDGNEEEYDQVLELPSQINYGNARQMPMTAAVDGPNNRFTQHQQRGMNPNSVPFSPAFGANQAQAQQTAAQVQAQAQAIQMQMMQMEIFRLQAMQAQQYQAEIIAQAQRQQAQQQQPRRASAGFIPPASAGPASMSFPSGINSQFRRGNQAELLKAQLGLSTSSDQDNTPVPMTAALGGKFGSRSLSMGSGAIGQFGLPTQSDEESVPVMNITPPTPSSTTVISGGTALGHPSGTTAPVAIPSTPSKSESATSWRRGGNNNSVLSGNNRGSISISPGSRMSASPSPPRSNSAERSSPPLPALNANSIASKSRPLALKFNAAASQSMMPAVAIDRAEDSAHVLGSAVTDYNLDSSVADDGYSTADSSKSGRRSTSPTTPRSATSTSSISASNLSISQDYMHPPLSPREEASKKLYEGLGIGRPGRSPGPQEGNVSTPHANYIVSAPPMTASYRVASQPVRQPIGPPPHVEELGPKNFATRLRRKAIGGIGAALSSARERREILEL